VPIDHGPSANECISVAKQNDNIWQRAIARRLLVSFAFITRFLIKKPLYSK